MQNAYPVQEPRRKKSSSPKIKLIQPFQMMSEESDMSIPLKSCLQPRLPIPWNQSINHQRPPRNHFSRSSIGAQIQPPLKACHPNKAKTLEVGAWYRMPPRHWPPLDTCRPVAETRQPCGALHSHGPCRGPFGRAATKPSEPRVK